MYKYCLAKQQLAFFLSLGGKEGIKKADVIKEMGHFRTTAPNQSNTIS